MEQELSWWGPAGAMGGSWGAFGGFPSAPSVQQAGLPLPDLVFHVLEKPKDRPGALWALEQPLC